MRGDKCTKHDGGATALASDQFGHRVDHVGGEGDDGRAARQAGDLLLAGIGELRKARPRNVTDAGQQFLDNGAHGGGAQQHRLLAAAAMHEAIGENVAAFEVGGELNFIDCKKRDIDIGGHRLDGADPEARLRRDDLFLAGDESDLMIADPQAHAVIDFARQQPQRQADHARGMAKHALDREMGLARIGGTEDCGDATRDG